MKFVHIADMHFDAPFSLLNSKKNLGETRKTGTTIHFKPDGKIFSSTIFDFKQIAQRMKESAFLIKGLKITLEDKREGSEKFEEFVFDNGIKEFVTTMTKDKQPIIEYIKENVDSAVGEHMIKHVADRKGHDRRYGIDPQKIKDDLGWYPETTFEVGIKKTLKWYLDNKEWFNNVTSGAYQKYYEKMYKDK